MKYLFWFLMLILVILHQDYWQWKNDILVFGFLPHSLAYHLGISMAAAGLWSFAVAYCWPQGLENVEPETDDSSADAKQQEATK